MNAFVRPHTKLAAALLAAGMVSATSVVSLPADRELPTISADVAYTSAATDFLVGAGQGVEVLTALVGIHVDAVISLPFEATLAILAAARHPELSNNVLSFLVQRFVNPAVGDPIHAYPWDTRLAVARLADLLPYPLGPSASGSGLLLAGSQAFADVFNSVLGRLADPIPGFEAVQDVMNNTALGGAVVAGHLLARAPMNMAWNSVNYLGYLPANVLATLESAIQRPDQIPGLISNLVYGLLSPDPEIGLFGKLLNNIVDPFTWLPAPLGYTSDAMRGWAYQIRDIIAGVMSGMLSLLPAPVAPSALPSGAGAELGPRGGLSAGKGFVAPDAAVLADVQTNENPSDTTFLNGQTSRIQVLDISATGDVADLDADTLTGGAAAPDEAGAEKVDPDAVDSEKVDPDAVDSETDDSDAVDSETVDSDAVDSETDDADAVDSETDDADAVDSETDAAEPSKTEASTA
ncbi:hypothetical protein [Mycolicibacterium tusciae]|uniref:hypothetical protein n=1 Tax=Mycolicibacterium tusciae TaxID=75922 RepID=UPI001EF77F6C|nr:hypothetical protein [Mycolicibacterium tusciae]